MIIHDEKRDLYKSDEEGWPVYREIVAGIGWADPTGEDLGRKNWGVLVGLKEDGVYSVMQEFFGSMSELCKSLTSAKDELLIQRIFCDRMFPELILELLEYDGLTDYRSEGMTQRGQIQYLHSTSFWPTFRSRSTTARLIPLNERLTANMRGAFETVSRLITFGQLKIRPSLANLMRVQRLPMDDLLRHPAVHALAYPLIALEREKASELEDSGGPEIVYHNLERRS
jgi:hypothetical protein